MATRQRPSRKTPESMRYAYQVRLCYLHLYGTSPHSDLGVVRWDRLVREYYRDKVLPLDAARSIHETEVKP